MGKRIVVVAALVAACNSIQKLPPLEKIPDLHALALTADALPNTRGHVDVDGVKIAFRHTQSGPPDRTVVFVHGLLSASDTWRFVVGKLGTDHRLLLIDLMGCGASDKPDADDLPAGAYGPENLARQVLEVIRQRTKGKVAIVGHSLGGTIILRMLGSPALKSEYGDVVDRIDRAVLMSAVDFAVERTRDVFEQVVDTPDFVAAIGSWLGIIEELTARALVEGSADPKRTPREEARRMIEALSDSDTRHAAQAMIRAAIPFTEDRRPNWPEIEKLVADYKKIDKPTLVVWGARDEIFPSSMGYKLAAQIPEAWLHVLPKRKHQLPGEAPILSADLIRAFIADGGKHRARVVD